MPFTLTVRGHFDAAHFLRNYPGKCQHLHGHRFEYEVKVYGSKLDELGMLVDFTHIKKIIEDKYDHKLLNEIEPFDQINPTAENLALTIFQDLTDIGVVSVEIWEGPNASAKYSL